MLINSCYQIIENSRCTKTLKQNWWLAMWYSGYKLYFFKSLHKREQYDNDGHLTLLPVWYWLFGIGRANWHPNNGPLVSSKQFCSELSSSTDSSFWVHQLGYQCLMHHMKYCQNSTVDICIDISRYNPLNYWCCVSREICCWIISMKKILTDSGIV